MGKQKAAQKIPIEHSPPPSATRSKLSKEVSVMAWVENAVGEVLMVKQSAGKRAWTLPGGKVRGKESLVAALERELWEETGLKMRSSRLAGVYDRPDKMNLTFLFRVKLRGSTEVLLRAKEIEAAEHRLSLPTSATPSLKFFWGTIQSQSKDPLAV